MSTQGLQVADDSPTPDQGAMLQEADTKVKILTKGWQEEIHHETQDI